MRQLDLIVLRTQELPEAITSRAVSWDQIEDGILLHYLILQLKEAARETIQ